MGPLRFYHRDIYLLDLFTSVSPRQWPSDDEIWLICTFPTACVWAALCIDAFLLQLWPLKLICIEIPSDCGNEVMKCQGVARRLAAGRQCFTPFYVGVAVRSQTTGPASDPTRLIRQYEKNASCSACLSRVRKSLGNSLLARPSVLYCRLVMCSRDCGWSREQGTPTRHYTANCHCISQVSLPFLSNCLHDT